MITHTRWTAPILVALLVAACGGATGPASTAEPTPTAQASIGQSPSASETGPAPTICPSALPSAVSSVADLADPSCYGMAELTIDGWLAEAAFGVDEGQVDPSWTIPLTRLYAAPPTAAEFALDDLFSTEGGRWGPAVVSPPASGVDLSGLGRWVRVHGHFNDPAASACTSSSPDIQPADLGCERLFVVSALDGVPHPSPACPTTSPISMATFLAADARCFLGHNVRIAAWEDRSEGIGGMNTNYPFTHAAFHDTVSQLVSAPIAAGAVQPWIFPWTLAGSKVTFDKSALKVTVTGHFGDPASSTCTSGPYPDWTWSPPTTWAQHRCERLFVITGVARRN